MKRKLPIISLLLILFAFQPKAQTSLNTAVDFTATDCYGQEISLFEILDSGKYVLIDFFFTTCAPCQQIVPYVKEAYEKLGCNQHDVFFMEITDYDNNDACMEWVNQYGIEYPTIGTEGGGVSIRQKYGIDGFPTLILIAPDRSIVEKDIFPIFDSQTIISTLATYGIQEHDCSNITNCNPATNVTASINQDISSTVDISWTSPSSEKARNVILNESFENGIPSNWTTLDADGDGRTWITETDELETGFILHPNTGEGAVFSMSIYNTHDFMTGWVDLTPDNWLITPELTEPTEVKYWVRSQAVPEFDNETYGVYVSSTGTNIADFTSIFEENIHNGIGVVFTQRTLTLPVGTKYVAWRHFNSVGQYVIVLDDVEITSGNAPVDDYTYTVTRDGTTIASDLTNTSFSDTNVAIGSHEYCVKVVYADCTSESACASSITVGINDIQANAVQIYPNPAKELIFVKGDVTSAIMYNSLGQMVESRFNNGQIDITTLANGIYYLEIIGSDESRYIEKVIITK